MPVDRCVCHQVPFTTLNEMVRRGHDVETQSAEQIHAALSAKTKCSTGCGMCKPYILRMIETGQTSFPPITSNPH